MDDDFDSIDYKQSASASIEVSVTAGNLYYACHPVLIGHLRDDSLESAEYALDRNLNGLLSRYHKMGNYPQEIGQNQVFHCKGKSQAVIVGLGRLEAVSAAQIEKTIGQGIIQYLLDEYNGGAQTKELGLSILLVGTGYIGLSIKSSISAIIAAGNKANEHLLEANLGRVQLSKIELIEIYDDKAMSALRTLKILKEHPQLNFHLKAERIIEQPGTRRRLLQEDTENWWRRLTVGQPDDRYVEKTKDITSLSFESNSGIARAELHRHEISDQIVNPIINQSSEQNLWNQRYARMLFELLIPSGLKLEMQLNQPLLMILDKKAAEYPWELLQDSDLRPQPLATQAPLIRQLKTDNFRTIVQYPSENRALVVGDPDLGNRGRWIRSTSWS